MRTFIRSKRGALVPLLCGLLVVVGCSAPHPLAPLQPASADALRKSIEYLASDALEGRGIGTAGLDEAATYIGGYFRGLGLSPVPGQKDYYQDFTFTTVAGASAATSLSIDTTKLQAGVDFAAYAFSAEGSFSGGVVFAGYGITGAKDAAGNEYDDYAGVDVAGKVAMVMRFEPHNADGQSRLAAEGWSAHAVLEDKAKAAAERGASALLIVQPPRFHGAEMFLPLERRMGGAVKIPVIQIRQSVAEELLQSAGAADLATFQSQIDAQFRPMSLVLKSVRVSGNVALNRSDYKLKNVTAMLSGSGSRARRYIVIGAHYDHLGRGGFGSLTPASHEIHNGADDNASGTAAVLELARLLKQAGPLPRSVIFVTFSAEEQGLIGSRWWVDHPPVPLDRIDAMINLDMVGRLRNQTLYVGGGATARPFPAMLSQADEGSALQLKTAWDNGVAPSDNTSFVMRRVPVLFFWTGMHADYHRPTDDPDRINYDGAADIVNLIGRVVQEISQQREIRFNGATPSTQPMGVGRPGGGAALGVVPEYGGEDVNGVRISGTVPGSAAAKADLRPGDVLVELAGRQIRSIYDLTEILQSARPGATVRLKYLRDGKQRQADVTLGGREAQR